MEKRPYFLAHDYVFGNGIVLQWHCVRGQTKELNDSIVGLSDIFVPAYGQTELNFARLKPELVSTDFMLKSLAPLFDKPVDSIDFDVVASKIDDILKQFFQVTDWAAYSGAQDEHTFVVAVDQKTGQRLGAIQFFTTPEFELNTIKAALFGVIPEAHNRGIEQLLMSSIFKINPSIERIFLHTRSTNESDIARYLTWGFTRFEGTLPNWTDLQYFASQADQLQKAAETLVIMN